MRISDWSSDVCSSDLIADNATALGFNALAAGDSSTAAGGELHYTYYDAELMEDVTIAGTTAATGVGADAYGAGAQDTADLPTALGAHRPHVRRVGNAWGSQWRSWGTPCHIKKK